MSTISTRQSQLISSVPSTPAAGCKTFSRHPEKHVFFGDAAAIIDKLPAARIGSGRRLFYAIVEGHGQPRIYEYEQQAGSIYAVRVAYTDAQAASDFDLSAERTMQENQGRSCVGMAVQALPVYKALHFSPVGEIDFDPATSFSSLLDVQDDTFWRMSFLALC